MMNNKLYGLMIITLCTGIAFTGCGFKKAETASIDSAVLNNDASESVDGYDSNHQVICEADNKNAAENIAKKIDGELLSFEYGIAVIGTKEDADTVIKKAAELPEPIVLAKNGTNNMQ